MTTLDFLNLAAVALPTILAVVGILVSIEEIKTKSKRGKALWWGGLFVLGLGTSIIVFWQQSYATKEAREQTEQDAMTATAPLIAKLDSLSGQLRTLSASLVRPAAPPVPVVAQHPSKPFIETLTPPKDVSPESNQGSPAQPVAGVSFVQRDVVSTNPAEPYETQVIIQTTQTINNASFGIETDGDIDAGNFFVTGQPVMMNEEFGVIKNRRGVFLRFGYPAFSPDSPIVVTLHGKIPFHVIRVVDLRGQR